MRQKIQELKRKVQRLELEVRELEMDMRELLNYKEDAVEYRRALDGLERFERALDLAQAELERVTRRM